MNVTETAALLRSRDRVLLLTHVRPDGDTIGSAAALCRALRDIGKEAYLLPNPEITVTYAPYAAPYWAPEGWEPSFVVSWTSPRSPSCRRMPRPMPGASTSPSITTHRRSSSPPRRVWKLRAPPAARSSMRLSAS